MDILVRTGGDVVQVVEVVQRELAHRHVGMIGEHLVRENARPQRIVSIGELEFADYSIDQEILERRILELSRLNRLRIAYFEKIVTGAQHGERRGCADNARRLRDESCISHQKFTASEME